MDDGRVAWIRPCFKTYITLISQRPDAGWTGQPLRRIPEPLQSPQSGGQPLLLDLVRGSRIAAGSGGTGAVVLVSMAGAIGTLALTGDVGESGQALVATLEQLVAGASGGGVSSRSVGGQGTTRVVLAMTGSVGSVAVTVSVSDMSVSTVSVSGARVRALAVALLVLVDEVLLCWGLHHVDEDGLHLDATWVVLDVDLAQHDCWGLVEHHGSGLHHQWGMVDQDLGGRALDDDGGGTVDEDLTLVLGIGDRGGEGVALGVHRLVGDVLVGTIAALAGAIGALAASLGDASGISSRLLGSDTSVLATSSASRSSGSCSRRSGISAIGATMSAGHGSAIARGSAIIGAHTGLQERKRKGISFWNRSYIVMSRD